ncbi:SAM-dependent methyltransferase [Aurantimonas endophytica]|uniref:SAM-dependent methyltransferase n=1 Tax=Aurantimonas endophytica TaxID=1522175 RepID=A0A7W6HHX3_9HYPH|nr:SAM-dependent methyltransferase [Aurantimonas endophytica]
MLHLFPQPPARVLDVGAGSGRDAAALATRGHRVVAVEPTESLRAEGMHRHEGKAIKWVDAQLPALEGLGPRAGRFDLILLTAVWMHLEEERQAGMEALASLLAPSGRLSLSLRHGPVPRGRRMFDVPAEETIALASSSGLRLVHCVDREDMLGRANVRWSFVVVEKH